MDLPEAAPPEENPPNELPPGPPAVKMTGSASGFALRLRNIMRGSLTVDLVGWPRFSGTTSVKQSMRSSFGTVSTQGLGSKRGPGWISSPVGVWAEELIGRQKVPIETRTISEFLIFHFLAVRNSRRDIVIRPCMRVSAQILRKD